MRGPLFIILFTVSVTSALGQIVFMPSNISVSYVGEMITNPGAKISLNYTLKHWRSISKDGRGLAKTHIKNYQLNFSGGFFYHKRYQTALFFLPEFEYHSANRKGRFWGVGAGLGYMRTLIPNTFEVNENGEVNSVNAGHNYGLASIYLTFGRDFYIAKNKNWKYFIKPQYVMAIPGFPNITSYFLLELGVAYRFRT